MTETRNEDLQSIGQSQLASIREMVAALECDYERLDELREMCNDYNPSAGHPDDENYDEDAEDDPNAPTWPQRFTEEAAELQALEAAAGDCKDQDDAEMRIFNNPLEITFRTRWMERRDPVERDDWIEACILLATGGPAVRIIVKLQNDEPHFAYLQVQDWGTPWTDYREEGIGELLMKYVSVFSFE